MEQRIITVDVGSGAVSEKPVPEQWKLLGGRGLTSTILSGEMDPTAHPLGEDNVLVFAPGLIAGSILSSCNRLSAGAKSPLTGTIKEANSGGVVGGLLSRLEVKALIIRGVASKETTTAIHLTPEGTKIIETPELRAKSMYETAATLREKYGPKAGLIVNGPAGEMRLPTACLSITDPEGEPCRNLGRGGLGAVAGSKGIKAIIVETGSQKRSVADPDGLKDLAKRFTRALRAHPTTGDKFARYGTVMTLAAVNSLGGLATRNFSQGTFEGADSLNGETLYETITSRGGDHAHGCMPGCVIRCSNKYVDAAGEPVVGSVDFETVCLLGSNIGLASLDQVALLNRLCNEIGVDTMETGAALGVLAEAGVFAFGDFDSARKIISEIGEGTPLGRLVASGAAACGKAYGVSRVPVVKGQGMAAYDPRGIKGLGLTYAMSPMGADHTAGNAITLEVDHLDPKAQLEPVRELHARTMVMDSLGACLFTGRVALADTSYLEEAIRVITGESVSFDDLTARGMELLKLERAFNRRAGFTSAHDRIPEFMRKEPLSPHETVYDVSEEDHDRFYGE